MRDGETRKLERTDGVEGRGGGVHKVEEGACVMRGGNLDLSLQRNNTIVSPKWKAPRKEVRRTIGRVLSIQQDNWC